MSCQEQFLNTMTDNMNKNFSLWLGHLKNEEEPKLAGILSIKYAVWLI